MGFGNYGPRPHVMIPSPADVERERLEEPHAWVHKEVHRNVFAGEWLRAFPEGDINTLELFCFLDEYEGSIATVKPVRNDSLSAFPVTSPHEFETSAGEMLLHGLLDNVNPQSLFVGEPYMLLKQKYYISYRADLFSMLATEHVQRTLEQTKRFTTVVQLLSDKQVGISFTIYPVDHFDQQPYPRNLIIPVREQKTLDHIKKHHHG